MYDGTLLVGTTLADSSGKWSIQTSLLSNGLHIITTKATDSTGTLSPTSNVVNITIDTIKPTIKISSTSDGETISTTPFTVSGIASDANLRQVNVSVDSGSYTTVFGTTSWIFDSASLADGVHTINAKVTDNAKNIQTTSITITVQTNISGEVTSKSGSIGKSTMNLR